MDGNFKSMQDTWSRALALVATMGSKLGGGWMGVCAQKARMGLRPFPVYSNCKQGWKQFSEVGLDVLILYSAL